MELHGSPALPRYLGQHGLSYHEEVSAVPERFYGAVSRLRAQKFQRHLTVAHSVLEYGAGLGYNLAALRCHERVAFDVGEHLHDAFRAQGIPFVTDTSAYADGHFDTVICHHVLEHVPEPWGALKEMRRLTRRGGKLLLNVPYEKERRYRLYDMRDRNGHLFSWNVQTLGALLQASGWDIETLHIRPFGYDRFAAVAADRLRLGERGYRFIRAILLRLRPRYEIQAVLQKNT